jgi:hypothetical protein
LLTDKGTLKMTSSIRVALYSLTSLAALALAGCGDDTPKKAAEAPAAQQSQPQAEAAAASASGDRFKGCTLNAETSDPRHQKFSPLLCVDLELTGAKTLKLSNSTLAPNISCAAWVKKRGIDPSEMLMWMGNMAPDGQAPVYASFTVHDYQGPGAYTDPKVMDGGGGQTGIHFGEFGGSSNEDNFTMTSDMTVLVPGAKAALDVQADGGVKLLLTGLHHRVYKSAAEGGEYSHSEKIDAKLAIRCIDPVK